MSPSIVPHPPGAEPKPVRDLLEDIHRRGDFSREPRGFVNPRVVDRIAFIASFLSVVLCAATLLVMVWEEMDPRLGLRLMASVFIILFAILTFRSINRSFSGD